MGVQDNTLEARVAALEAQLAAVRRAAPPASRAAIGIEADQPAPPQAESERAPVADRRGVVKLLAATAAGAVAGVALKGQPVAAADGDALTLGEVNEATTLTELHASDDTALYLSGEGGYGVEAWGGFGNALFDAWGEAPLGRAAWAGTLIVDDDGNWWAATKSDEDDGRWRKLAGQNTAGALHLLDAPKRVYDSRPVEPPTSIGPKSPLAPNAPRSVDPAGNGSGVPAQARGVLITLTMAPLAAGGFATVWPSGGWPGTSNVNFNAGQPIAATTVVGLGPDAKFLVQANVATDVVIDIVGYYL